MLFLPQDFKVRVLAGFVIFAPAVVSCDTVAVTSVAVASVDVVPAAVELVTGRSAQLVAIALDGTGAQLSTTGVQWTATPSEIVQVDASGRITALAPGTATVFAATGGIVGTAAVSVGVPGLLVLSANELNFSAAEGEASPPPQAIQIGIGDSGTVMGLATNVVYETGSPGWLGAAVSANRAPAVLTLTATTGVLTQGVHTARVDVTSNSATNSPTQIRVTFTVTEALPVIQLSPTDLSFAGTENRSVAVTNAGAGDLTGLRAAVVYGPGAPTGWIAPALSSSTAPATLIVAADDSGLPPGTHQAQVVVSSSVAGVAPVTLSVTLQGGQQSPLLKATPASVVFTASLGNAATASVGISNAGTGSLTGLRKAIGYGAGQPTGWLVASLSSTSAPATLSVVANTSGLAIGSYNASIEVLANAPNSPVIVPVFLTVTPVPVQPPAPPSALSATPGTNPTAVTLGWKDNSSNETAFDVRRRSGGGAWQIVATPAADAQAYVDTGVTIGVTYDYQVRSCNVAGCSAWSNTASATVVVPPQPPVAPAGLTATAASSPATVTLGWTDNSSNETHFDVRRRVGSAAWQIVATPAANAQAYIDTAVTAGATYTYQVRSCNAVGCSSWSNTATATVVAPPQPPVAPAGLTATAASSPATVALGWTDNSSNETRFDVRRRVGSAAWQIVATPAANAQAYIDTAVTAGATYSYRVRACNAVGCSAWSNTASATVVVPPQPPVAPAGLTATAASSPATVALGWTDNSSNETRFDVRRRVGSAAWQIVASPAANTQTYIDTAVTAGATYSYRVRACNAAGCSAWSAVATAMIPALPPIPRSPTNPVILSASRQQVVIGWTDVSTNETHFVIEEGSPTTSWAPIGQVGANVTTFTDTQVVVGSLIQYRVRACNPAGCSGAFTVSVLVP